MQNLPLVKLAGIGIPENSNNLIKFEVFASQGRHVLIKLKWKSIPKAHYHIPNSAVINEGHELWEPPKIQNFDNWSNFAVGLLAPQRLHDAPISMKFGTKKQTTCSLLSANFHYD